MSGNSKRILYNVIGFVLWLAAFAGAVLLILFTVPKPIETSSFWLVWTALLLIALRIPATVHEMGHLLFGWLCGMKFAGVTVSYLRIAGGKVRFVRTDYKGSTEMYPKNGKHVFGKTLAFTLGGAVFCLAVGGLLLALYFILPYNDGCLFGALMGIYVLYEGLIALYPAELPAGKTDGAVLLGLLKRAPEENVMLRVLTAQGILYKGTYQEIEKDLLFSAPVVREDLPAYHALLRLQVDYLKEMGETEEMQLTLERLRSLQGYLTEEERRELEKFGT